MFMIPIRWSFRRPNALFILEAIGETMVKESEQYLIIHAAEMIEEASKFNGRAYPKKPEIESQSALMVSFSLVFPSEKNINQYMEFLKKTYGP